MKRKQTIRCDTCGAEIQRYPSQIKRHNFCCRRCLADYASKAKNPGTYAELKCLDRMSENMKAINARLNPTRMTPAVRAKLRAAHLKKSGAKGYPKFFGRHEHRTVAELALGRPLRAGEVVHHIDGNKRNNSYSNLMVFASQAEHAAWHKAHDKEVVPDDVQTA